MSDLFSLLFREYQEFVDKEIEDARETQGDEVADHGSLIGEFVDQEQETHLDGEACDAGGIVGQETGTKGTTRVLLDAVLPDKEVGQKEIGEHGTFERDGWGRQESTYIIVKDVVCQHKQDCRVDTRAGQSAGRKFDISE